MTREEWRGALLRWGTGVECPSAHVDRMIDACVASGIESPSRVTWDGTTYGGIADYTITLDDAELRIRWHEATGIGLLGPDGRFGARVIETRHHGLQAAVDVDTTEGRVRVIVGYTQPDAVQHHGSGTVDAWAEDPETPDRHVQAVRHVAIRAWEALGVQVADSAAGAFDRAAGTRWPKRADVARVLGITRSTYGDLVTGRRSGASAVTDPGGWLDRWAAAGERPIILTRLPRGMWIARWGEREAAG